MARTRKRSKRRRRRTVRKGRRRSVAALSGRTLNAMIQASRQLLHRGSGLRVSPAKRRKLKQLAACTSCRQARKVIQRGGFLPIIPLLAGLAPLIGKALLGVGTAAAGSAVGAAIKKAINK